MAASGMVIWLTGLPAAGKTTLAQALISLLAEQGFRPVLMDSDQLRSILTPEPTYSAAERDWFYGILADLAVWLADQELCALVAATAHRRVYRDRARSNAAHFAEVFVQCPLSVAKARDPKGIYARAVAGEADTVPGLDVAFEAPLNPEAIVDTSRLSPEEAARSVIKQLRLPAGQEDHHRRQ